MDNSKGTFIEYSEVVEDQRIAIGGTWGRATHVAHFEGTTNFYFIPELPAPGNVECRPIAVVNASDKKCYIINPEMEKGMETIVLTAIVCILGGILWAAFAYVSREFFGQPDFSTLFR